MFPLVIVSWLSQRLAIYELTANICQPITQSQNIFITHCNLLSARRSRQQQDDPVSLSTANAPSSHPNRTKRLQQLIERVMPDEDRRRRARKAEELEPAHLPAPPVGRAARQRHRIRRAAALKCRRDDRRDHRRRRNRRGPRRPGGSDRELAVRKRSRVERDARHRGGVAADAQLRRDTILRNSSATRGAAFWRDMTCSI